MFIFYFLGVGPPCCSILCQFWLCEEAHLSTYAAILVPPIGVFTQKFEALFPGAGALGCVVCFAPCHLSGLSVLECGATGSASGQTACPVHPTLRQSQSRHGHVSPLHPGARLRPSYQSG